MYTFLKKEVKQFNEPEYDKNLFSLKIMFFIDKQFKYKYINCKAKDDAIFQEYSKTQAYDELSAVFYEGKIRNKLTKLLPKTFVNFDKQLDWQMLILQILTLLCEETELLNEDIVKNNCLIYEFSLSVENSLELFDDNIKRGK